MKTNSNRNIPSQQTPTQVDGLNRYLPHLPKFPSALETKNLLLHDIEIKYEQELLEVFLWIEQARINYQTSLEFENTIISTPVLIYLQEKGYRIRHPVVPDKTKMQSYKINGQISW